MLLLLDAAVPVVTPIASVALFKAMSNIIRYVHDFS